MDETFLEKIMSGEDTESINKIMAFFDSEECKEKFGKIDEIYNSIIEKSIKELELKANEGDIHSILTLKYKDIVSKMLELMDKTTNTKNLNADIVINCFDDILAKINTTINMEIDNG